MQLGYLISFDFATKFSNDEGLYTLQSPLVWSFDRRKPSEMGKDLKMPLNVQSTFAICRDKREIFTTLKEKPFASFSKLTLPTPYSGLIWRLDSAHNRGKLQCSDSPSLLDNLTREESKRFNLQEFGLWQFCIAERQLDIEIEEELSSEQKKQHHTESVFESTATPQQLLPYWSHKVATLKLVLKIHRVPYFPIIGFSDPV